MTQKPYNNTVYCSFINLIVSTHHSNMFKWTGSA